MWPKYFVNIAILTKIYTESRRDRSAFKLRHRRQLPEPEHIFGLKKDEPDDKSKIKPLFLTNKTARNSANRMLLYYKSYNEFILK